MVSQEVRNVIVQAHVLQVSTCLDNGPWTVMNHDVLEQVGGFNRKSCGAVNMLYSEGVNSIWI